MFLNLLQRLKTGKFDRWVKEINAKEINAVDEVCFQFLNEINAVTSNRFQIV